MAHKYPSKGIMSDDHDRKAMKSNSSDAAEKQYTTKVPMIIAINGHSSSNKSEIALKLADFLKYTLIDGDDLISPLKYSAGTSSYPKPISFDYLKEQSFEITHKISSIQLNLKLSVIINAPLSQPAQYNRLEELAHSAGTHLVIIERKTQKNQGHDHDHVEHNIPKISINPTKQFDPEHFAPVLLRVIESNESIGLEVLESSNKSKSSSLEKPDDVRDFTEMHVHEFELFKEPKKGCEKFNCNKCQELISGPTYHCTECDDFILHKMCAESKSTIKDKTWKSYISETPPKYNFPKLDNCKICPHFSHNCCDCLYQTHLRSDILPTILSYPHHKHNLNYIIMPLSYNHQYKCCECNVFGKSISYKCFLCNFDIHIKCALTGLEQQELLDREIEDIHQEIEDIDHQEIDDNPKEIEDIGHQEIENIQAARMTLIKNP